MKHRSGRLLISSSELGECLGVSQQTASRYLSDLELGGFIERSRGGRGQFISLTRKGLDVLDGVYLNLKTFFDEIGTPILIKGRVVQGFGEGAYYVKEYSKSLREGLGFEPFFGTLNIKPLRPFPFLEKYVVGEVKGFSKGGRSFGSLKYVSAILSSSGWTEDCFIIIPKRTHHLSELEVVCEHGLREKHGIKDGDLLQVELKV